MSFKEFRLIWTLEEHAAIKAAAEKEGMTLKAFIAEAIAESIENYHEIAISEATKD